MGIKIQTIPIGNECAQWDPPAETPEFIYALFWDILKGDMFGAFEPPNGHIFTLYQMDGIPCTWKHSCSGYGWQVLFGITPTQTWIDLVDCVHVNAHYFGRTIDISPPPEYQTFTNFYGNPFGNWGYNGYAIIFWLEGALTLKTELGLDWLDDVMLEVLPVDLSNLIIKFCSKHLAANIKLKISI